MKTILLISLGLGLLLAIRELWIIIKRSVKALRLKRIRACRDIDLDDIIRKEFKTGSGKKIYMTFPFQSKRSKELENMFIEKTKKQAIFCDDGFKHAGKIFKESGKSWNSFTGYNDFTEDEKEAYKRSMDGQV